ncbi:hypothetical protein HMPREF0454_01993 [Hafnia alvei ATCC 51873]|uniref:Uncharacterized protein n=1 Tax=Hafnia alvei ATCC 51873 TaxID=1002364 RepID=G9Y630_HAFAL|nr:hypothetical protein HMPREF0454_01993 [Hafnia alvei ATCC 51873]
MSVLIGDCELFLVLGALCFSIIFRCNSKNVTKVANFNAR